MTKSTIYLTVESLLFRNPGHRSERTGLWVPDIVSEITDFKILFPRLKSVTMLEGGKVDVPSMAAMRIEAYCMHMFAWLTWDQMI